ncbi:MAG: hypothetical protein Q8K86_08165 [Candidatus Nanopelagicaceae bacterium]|nr:hypothetical protein [Candidatus Nanopelagicaceae bacterium]
MSECLERKVSEWLTKRHKETASRFESTRSFIVPDDFHDMPPDVVDAVVTLMLESNDAARPPSSPPSAAPYRMMFKPGENARASILSALIKGEIALVVRSLEVIQRECFPTSKDKKEDGNEA